MSSLGDLEKRSYRATIDDGLPDIVLGLFLLSVGAAMATSMDYLPAVVFVLSVPFWKHLRIRVVEPRTGHLKLHPTRLMILRQNRGVLKILGFTILLGILVIFFVGGETRSAVRIFGGPLLGLLLAFVVGVAAFLFRIQRGYVYSLWILLAFILSHLGGFFPGSGALASGVVVATWGFVLLTNLVRHNPVDNLNTSGD